MVYMCVYRYMYRYIARYRYRDIYRLLTLISKAFGYDSWTEIDQSTLYLMVNCV